MDLPFLIDDQPLRYSALADFVFRRQAYSGVELSPACRQKVAASHLRLQALLEERLPIYGVTTGFGDSVSRFIEREQAEQLQANLVSYLLCGTGPNLPVEASRATALIRLKSLCRGYSGVSLELIDRMRLYVERDWVPVIPREGSLGASGDLIPLAYLARVLQGQGELHVGGAISPTAQVLKAANVAPYVLKPKEGLALVNGTSAMAGMFLVNFTQARYLTELVCVATSWLCLALKGRAESFGELVNERAQIHPGQARAARMIRELLAAESYQARPLASIAIRGSLTEEPVQDRYSLRCTPQVLGPVLETLAQLEGWLETEINGASDNPLLGEDGSLAMGGNFYGGYLSQGMDYLKICLAHLADLTDRQVMLITDEKSNRGLPANLAAWNTLSDKERYLHHGLKGLNQAVSALTSEILARAIPNGIFSRSSEAHNQDKVSLGMSAAVQCMQMLEPLFTIMAMHLVCLAQALDLREVALQGEDSKRLYHRVRQHVPFVSQDMALGDGIRSLASSLQALASNSAT